MTVADLKALIEKHLPGTALKVVRESLLVENSADLPRVASFLKDCPELRMDFLSSVTGADYLTFLESVYHFYSTELRLGPVTLRARTSREEPKLPSLTPLFRSAEFQEREAYDMYGIVYEGHPDLRRLFMWDNFEGWPLRKDYEQEDSDVLESADVEWLQTRHIAVPEEAVKKAAELKASGKRATAQKPSQGESA